MKINTSYVIAAILLVAIGVWFAVNNGARNTEEARRTGEPKTVASTQDQDQALPSVVVERREASQHTNTLSLFGRTEPNREVSVKAETAGLVVTTPVAEGTFVKKGTVICRQDIDARQANLDQARANLQAREFDLQSTQTLVDKGFKSKIQLKSLQASVDGTIAQVKQAEIELDNVNMRAPFASMFEKQMAEIGDYLAPGQPCGQLVELSPLIVTIDLTESQIGLIETGQTATVKLATGEDLTGEIRFIEARANQATRTFRTEISLPNPDYKLKAGVTATVSLKGGTTMAQHIPSKILALDASGSVGVRYLDDRNIVRFAAVNTIDEDEKGIWVTGLPDDTRIIVQGQDFVGVGTEVSPSLDAFNSANRATE